jgi:rhamnosyltransferase subunit B
MAKIVLSTMGSLGDLHPMLALAFELRRRGHTVIINTWEGYAEKIGELGFDFHPLRPNIDPADRELLRRVMDARKGPEMVIKELMIPSVPDMYEDLTAPCKGADLLVTGELVYAAPTFAEKTGVKWISTSLAPVSMFSSYDPSVFPTAEFLEYLRILPAFVHRGLFNVMRLTIRDWYDPYKKFRREMGMSEDHDPIFTDKFSKLLHLCKFSKTLGRPQPDWHTQTLQTGFCFYDESEAGELDPELADFLASGDAPIVFTLGSAAVMDARDFYEQSAGAAKRLGRRALLLYGRENEPPEGLNDDIVGFDYAPYSQVFPHAACVVHQGGVGTTAQVLRAGVPHLVMPYSHDQPDNAARCRRAGVAEIISRDDYTAANSARALTKILGNAGFAENARALKQIVDAEHGTITACNAIELILQK